MLSYEFTANAVRNASMMGYAVMGPNSPGTTVAMEGRSFAAMNPCQRHRPSHGALQKGRGSFARHWTRWADENHVPMPFRRGIPVRGDALGDSLLILPPMA
jgi:hypothetical protein